VLFSIILIFISRNSLRTPRSHGFWRFFAWELMLMLFLLNVNAWFRTPFCWNQLISWGLLFTSFVPLWFGIRVLITRGKPGANRPEQPELMAFEKTSALVTTGIYRYIRHPLYSSLVLLVWGIFFKVPSLPGIALTLTATGFLILTAKADEAECTRFFGSDYSEYMKKTKMFIPFVF
jgi:protein-S-isoprenylcysteine O-methyltransferase Ste14